jgi:hypothetical protein
VTIPPSPLRLSGEEIRCNQTNQSPPRGCAPAGGCAGGGNIALVSDRFRHNTATIVILLARKRPKGRYSTAGQPRPGLVATIGCAFSACDKGAIGPVWWRTHTGPYEGVPAAAWPPKCATLRREQAGCGAVAEIWLIRSQFALKKAAYRADEVYVTPGRWGNRVARVSDSVRTCRADLVRRAARGRPSGGRATAVLPRRAARIPLSFFLRRPESASFGSVKQSRCTCITVNR